ncbi:hypothetical protein N7470_001614 [Penicillium chermesinum]|nr:hypothetical protein N7470_001614 [Penicillium chermesinum]
MANETYPKDVELGVLSDVYSHDKVPLGPSKDRVEQSRARGCSLKKVDTSKIILAALLIPLLAIFLLVAGLVIFLLVEMATSQSTEGN